MKDILWDREKNEWLIENRGISFQEIEEKIRKDEIIKVQRNKSKNFPNQFLLIIQYYDYIWNVPCVITDTEIVLKTAFPNRKYNKIYHD